MKVRSVYWIGGTVLVGLVGMVACTAGGGGGGGARGQLIDLSACAAGLDTAALAAEATALINEQRTRSGVAALVVDPTLTQVAQEFAEEMIALGFADHENPITGERVGDRMTAAGYVWTDGAENLAFGQCSANQVTNDWITSTAGHFENLINSVYTETGVGLAQGGPERMYWVQVFARPAG